MNWKDGSFSLTAMELIMTRYVHLSLGWLCLALGAVGAVLPIMPTTVFIILAAFFFTKGSPRLRQWLLDSPHFGPPIRAWEETGAIPRRIKVLALTMMACGLALSAYFGFSQMVLVVQALCMAAVSAYIVSRPDA